ncbi:MAG: ATP synthase F0 subunit B [Desulfovibrionaceae bacterium]|nr:ATP synthase F0 subunit B [Desulfovibrionaceae bacterium]
MINIDITVVIQLVNFLIALVIVNWLLVRPIREVLLRRKHIVDDLNAYTAFSENRSRELLDNYESELAKVRADAAAERKSLYLRAEAEGQEVVKQANGKAQESLQQCQNEVRKEADEASASLRAELKTYAEAAVAKILG